MNLLFRQVKMSLLLCMVNQIPANLILSLDPVYIALIVKPNMESYQGRQELYLIDYWYIVYNFEKFLSIDFIIYYIFICIFQQYPNKKFRITVSFIELTSAGIYDLLNTSYYKNEIFVSFNEKVSEFRDSLSEKYKFIFIYV